MVYTELHRACDHSQWSLVRTLVADDPAAVLELDQFGRLPLHAAASHDALLSTQRLLFERNPAGLLMRDAEFNNTPLDWAVKRNTHPVPSPPVPDLLQLLPSTSSFFLLQRHPPDVCSSFAGSLVDQEAIAHLSAVTPVVEAAHRKDWKTVNARAQADFCRDLFCRVFWGADFGLFWRSCKSSTAPHRRRAG